jgi:DNA modification methylase
MKNTLYYGDNLEVLRKYIKDETVDLCYIDPPFNSKRNYNQIYNNIGQDDKAQAQAFIDTWTWDTIAEQGLAEITSNYNGVFTKQSINLIVGLEKVLGKGDLLAYLVSMTLRIAEIYRVLKQTGCFYLHCDPTASHYLKLVLDSIFCAKGGDFKNEIIWCYTAPSKVASYFPRKHDVIFFYTKSEPPKMNFDEIRVPYSKESLSRAERNVTKKGGTIYDHVELNENGKIPEDWWADIVPASRKPGERLGYPTQKPLALLERIIKVSSNEGDIILDIYCGCGTTIAVAEHLKRKWIGVDITYQSISLILKRLEEHFDKKTVDNIILNGVPKDMDSAVALAHKLDDRTRKEFEKWAVLTFSNNKAIVNEKKGGDGGIDGISFVADMSDNNEPITKEVIFSVKSDKTQRWSGFLGQGTGLYKWEIALG